MKSYDKWISEIGDRIKEVRGRLSRKDFGKLIDEKQSSIQNYEVGQYKRTHTIPIDVLYKISKTFHINICWLIEGSPHKKEK